MASRWIQGAVKRPGALTRKAKAAGQSVQAYARSHRADPGLTGKQARLAITFKKMGARRRARGRR